MLNESELQQKVTSSDIEVLKISEKFLDEKIDSEYKRGESAEKRAGLIIGTLGACSAILVFFARNTLQSNESDPLITAIYIFAALWLARAVWYANKSFKTQSRKQFTHHNIFSIQDKCEIEARKEILIGKIWEYEQVIQPNSERLFYIQRAQRALITFIGILLTLGATTSFNDLILESLKLCIVSTLSAIALIYWIIGDKVIETNGVWVYKKDQK